MEYGRSEAVGLRSAVPPLLNLKSHSYLHRNIKAYKLLREGTTKEGEKEGVLAGTNDGNGTY